MTAAGYDPAVDPHWPARLRRGRMRKLGPATALAILADVATAQPGRVQTWPQYVADGQPHCLAGHVLHRAGASLSALNAADVAGPSGGSLPIWALLNEPYFSKIDPAAAALIATAQCHADTGMPWGLAASLAAHALAGVA